MIMFETPARPDAVFSWTPRTREWLHDAFIIEVPMFGDGRRLRIADKLREHQTNMTCISSMHCLEFKKGEQAT
jgi:hypothetical protein